MGQELIDGATLTGEIPVTGVLDTKLKPARIDIDELMSISDQVKQQIRSRTVSSGDHDMDKLLWEKTVEEAGKGQLSGPYSFDSLPQDCLVSSRFPLLQGGKLRPIDNYSSSLINAYHIMSVVLRCASDGHFGARYWVSYKKTGWYSHANGKNAKAVKINDTTIHARYCDAVFLRRAEESADGGTA